MLRWFQHPLTGGLSVDDPRTTELRREVLARKPFLRRIYREWYEAVAEAIPPPPGDALEIGSGAGFLREHVPGLITSDVLPLPGVSMVLDGERLPFADGALRAIAMTNVLHHIPRVREFLAEADRALRPGGAVVMVEPWNTPWSRFLYRHLHPEPFDPSAKEWEFPPRGPLSGANGALAWIVFRRDRRRFEKEFPRLAVASVRPMMPFRYLLSGGVGYRKFMPGASFDFWRRVERALDRWRDALAMFARIVLVKSAPM